MENNKLVEARNKLIAYTLLLGPNDLLVASTNKIFDITFKLLFPPTNNIDYCKLLVEGNYKFLGNRQLKILRYLKTALH